MKKMDGMREDHVSRLSLLTEASPPQYPLELVLGGSEFGTKHLELVQHEHHHVPFGFSLTDFRSGAQQKKSVDQQIWPT